MKVGYVDDLDVLIIGELINYSLMYIYMGLINYMVILYGKEVYSFMLD